MRNYIENFGSAYEARCAMCACCVHEGKCIISAQVKVTDEYIECNTYKFNPEWRTSMNQEQKKLHTEISDWMEKKQFTFVEYVYEKKKKPNKNMFRTIIRLKYNYENPPQYQVCDHSINMEGKHQQDRICYQGNDLETAIKIYYQELGK